MTANWHQSYLALEHFMLGPSTATDRERSRGVPFAFDRISALFVLTLLVAGLSYVVRAPDSREIVVVFFCGILFSGLFTMQRLRLGKELAAAREAQRRAEEEAERRRLEARLQHHQRMESLGLLAGGIAHELNNLLTVVLGNAELALTLEPTPPMRRLLETIDEAGRRAARLTNKIVAFSGTLKLRTETLDLSALVEESAPWMEAAVPKKVKLHYDLAPDLPAVRIDSARIRQVMAHLLTNAREAVGDEVGLISIATGVGEYDREALADFYLAGDLAPGTYVHLEVSDTGCGMDDATRAKIFDPFFSTKLTGRGLGMAAALGIVRAHQGAIRVASEPGCWTSIRLLFPV